MCNLLSTYDNRHINDSFLHWLYPDVKFVMELLELLHMGALLQCYVLLKNFLFNQIIELDGTKCVPCF